MLEATSLNESSNVIPISYLQNVIYISYILYTVKFYNPQISQASLTMRMPVESQRVPRVRNAGLTALEGKSTHTESKVHSF